MDRIKFSLLGTLALALGIYGYVFHADDDVIKPVRQDDPGTATSVAGNTAAGIKVPGQSRATNRSSGNSASRRPSGDDPAALVTQWGRSDFDADNAFEDNELVVIDAPGDFEDRARSLNYFTLDRVRLGALSMTVYRVRTPVNLDMVSARGQLRQFFPAALITANYQFDLAAGRTAAAQTARGSKTRVSHVRAAIGWPDVPQSCGSGIRIGMIDTSVDQRHPALRDRNVEFRSFHNGKRRPGGTRHGTAVASMLVGKPSNKGLGGILPGAILKAANMFEHTSSGKLVGNLYALMRSMNWLIGARVHAINLSIAGSKNAIMRRAIAKAEKLGIAVIAAAGNWGVNGRPAFPAAYSNVLAVTAVKSNQIIYKRANRGNYIDFAAPGVRLYLAAPGGGGTYHSGTSFAAPYLTALAAIEVAEGRRSGINNLRVKFARTSADLGPKGKDRVFGWGYLEEKPICSG